MLMALKCLLRAVDLLGPWLTCTATRCSKMPLMVGIKAFSEQEITKVRSSTSQMLALMDASQNFIEIRKY